MKDRKFYKQALNHCYQRSKDHGVIFYTVRDHLVFFTIFCTMARRHGVHVYKLVQMPNHIHHSTVARSLRQLTNFVRDYTSLYAREVNHGFGRTGPLFDAHFGSAPKRDEKTIRTHLLYLDNNPVERKLVQLAQDYQWNYMAYAANDHPFSEPVKLRFASMPLRKALKRVAWLRAHNQYLRFDMLDKLFKSLPNNKERDQLVDFIITTYSAIEHQKAAAFFGGYEKEEQAAQYNTGSEYDINEVFLGKSDTVYALFADLLHRKADVEDIHDILTATTEQKKKWQDLLTRETNAPARQIAAFLHLPVEIKH